MQKLKELPINEKIPGDEEKLMMLMCQSREDPSHTCDVFKGDFMESFHVR